MAFKMVLVVVLPKPKKKKKISLGKFYPAYKVAG